ncbi:hypothetical protein COY25_02185 [Candidatus Uhrbacteria bacterium CG_4_10_14_0_2_um_filter_41_7]|nr:MAG: hypothetical protein COY25_02185 [Candidatus Uhrbacteria bacterium CG_4_10_14_0_2_um_filter_41_7]
MSHAQALDKAKIGLMMLPNTLFYTTILFSLSQVWDKQIATAAVDGVSLFINPDWFVSLSPRARIGLLAHELLHVALNHMTRRNTRDARLWNCAGDYVINLTLCQNGYELPEDGLVDRQFEDMSTEQVYEILKQDTQDAMSIPGIGEDIIYPGSDIETKEIEAKITDAVLRGVTQARTNAKEAGAIPGEILIQLDKFINPKLKWDVILANYMSNFSKDDFSWQKPNRRFLPDYYLPSVYSESICDLAIAVDVSGSVTDAEFSHFIAEIANIQTVLHPEKITLISFNIKIVEIKEITNDPDLLNLLTFTGRGGTNIKELMNWVHTNKPTVTLIFTDGEFLMVDNPGTPIVWLVHNNSNFKAPYGEVITYEIY